MLEFKSGGHCTVGIELELQLVSLSDYDLFPASEDMLRLFKQIESPADLKPEITHSMIEVNSSPHQYIAELQKEMLTLRDQLTELADRINIGISGGGSHPFHRWQEQKIFPGKRFAYLADTYGYLAKQFTVFGQHIHIGCETADDAIYLSHVLSRYIPHFIALSAASPFSQEKDTSFDSSRLHAIASFPLAGHLPLVRDWQDFSQYFERMHHYGIVKSMKDFYWDIRPKPEFGTVEIRVCDTPLTVQTAVDLAAFAQCIAYKALDQRTKNFLPENNFDQYDVYSVNRFQASRFGMEALFIDAQMATTHALRDDFEKTFSYLQTTAQALGVDVHLARLKERCLHTGNDAQWLRNQLHQYNYLPWIVRDQVQVWRNSSS